VQGVVDFCRRHGVLVGRSGGGARHSNTIVLSPPLIITRSECDTLIDVLDRALGETTAKLAGA
jgi:4-aminobutyrate aminotransferase-like enzyme